MREIKELLELTIKEGASDLHLSAGHPPIMRIARKLIPLVRREVLDSEKI
ncbi:type IV pili twitching motility protein PilT, partial [Patescibacteria group bacterium]|nr:type IV pili twitching motility protein PilT [Patescibacteria group bacterium]